MKRTELERHLRNHGCLLHHHGGNHDVWLNPENMRKVSVPRRREIKNGTVRAICGRLLMTSPDGPSQGWYRVNAQGVDMNRSYFVAGAHPQKQAHEAYVVQKDLEALMASDAPATTLWGMHTWAGLVEPILVRGPEMGTVLGPWDEFRQIIQENDPQDLIKPLAIREKPGSGAHWNNGPHLQFGITTVLCEGSGDWTCKQRSLDAGTILMKSLAQYYEGLRPGQGGEQ